MNIDKRNKKPLTLTRKARWQDFEAHPCVDRASRGDVVKTISMRFFMALCRLFTTLTISSNCWRSNLLYQILNNIRYLEKGWWKYLTSLGCSPHQKLFQGIARYSYWTNQNQNEGKIKRLA
jgi:hypothetical protein